MASEHRDQHGPDKEDEVDRDSADSFPASDPPSYSGITGTGNPAKKPPPQERDPESKPTGTPTSDRHATETTHQREDQERPDTPKRGRD